MFSLMFLHLPVFLCVVSGLSTLHISFSRINNTSISTFRIPTKTFLLTEKVANCFTAFKIFFTVLGLAQGVFFFYRHFPIVFYSFENTTKIVFFTESPVILDSGNIVTLLSIKFHTRFNCLIISDICLSGVFVAELSQLAKSVSACSTKTNTFTYTTLPNIHKHTNTKHI